MVEGDIWYRCRVTSGLYCRGRYQADWHISCMASSPILRNAGLLVDHGVCHLCHHCQASFTAEEWDVRHTDSDGEDVHEECCDVCHGDDPAHETAAIAAVPDIITTTGSWFALDREQMVIIGREFLWVRGLDAHRAEIITRHLTK